MEWNEFPVNRRSLLAEERKLRKQQPMGWAKQHHRIRGILRGKFAELKAQGKTLNHEELSVFLHKIKKEQGLTMRQNPPY